VSAFEDVFVRLGPEHISSLATVECDSFASPWPTSDLRSLLADANVVCVGTFVQCKLVAYALGYHQGESFHLASMAVAPSFRRQGIGEALLRHVLEEVKERGCARCTLEVRVGNSAARRLYCNAGFMQVRWMEDYYDNPRDDGLELVLVVV